MKYKGYQGFVNFDDEANIFHGEVLGLKDVITFQGTSVDELVKAFQDSIDDYLNFCNELGRSPEKPFSGKLVLRLTPEMHERIAREAKSDGISLNSWIKNGVERMLNTPKRKDLIKKIPRKKTSSISSKIVVSSSQKSIRKKAKKK